MFRRRLIGLLPGASRWTESVRADEQVQPIVEKKCDPGLGRLFHENRRESGFDGPRLGPLPAGHAGS